jgi:hypothetical protein
VGRDRHQVLDASAIKGLGKRRNSGITVENTISLIDLSMRWYHDEDADPDIPILKEAKAEHARLQ